MSYEPLDICWVCKKNPGAPVERGGIPYCVDCYREQSLKFLASFGLRCSQCEWRSPGRESWSEVQQDFWEHEKEFHGTDRLVESLTE